MLLFSTEVPFFFYVCIKLSIICQNYTINKELCSWFSCFYLAFIFAHNFNSKSDIARYKILTNDTQHVARLHRELSDERVQREVICRINICSISSVTRMSIISNLVLHPIGLRRPNSISSGLFCLRIVDRVRCNNSGFFQKKESRILFDIKKKW